MTLRSVSEAGFGKGAGHGFFPGASSHRHDDTDLLHREHGAQQRRRHRRGAAETAQGSGRGRSRDRLARDRNDVGKRRQPESGRHGSWIQQSGPGGPEDVHLGRDGDPARCGDHEQARSGLHRLSLAVGENVSTLGGTWDALPTLPTWILYWGAVLAALPFLLFYIAPDSSQWPIDIFRYVRNAFGDHLVTMAGLTFAGLIFTAALLRGIVYFRDNYRATNYGVPDLVQVIRAIDGKIGELRRSSEWTNDVELSFIGHSMGGFVVTNTIRVLSDVFASQVSDFNAYGAGPSGEGEDAPSPNVGRCFQLKRFVLASPDIPGETLLSSRGNFLRSALKRFDEAYLFSNEGDEVLRQISTLANYFVFPTKSRNHGFRLGNTEILSRNFGMIDVNGEDFLRLCESET